MTEAVLVRRIANAKGVAAQRICVERIEDIAELDLPDSVKERVRGCLNGALTVSVIEAAVRGELCTFVVERISHRRSLVVFGAGHVGQSVAAIGAMLGLDVSLVDDRPEFLAPDRMASRGIVPIVSSLSDIGNQVRFDRRAAVVIVTRGHQYDEAILRQVATHDVGYVGMIGSRKRVRAVLQELRKDRVAESFLASVKAPIGLEIGAKSPQEIAIAIHAEIIRHFNVVERA